MSEQLFGLVFVLALPLWLAMVLFPRHPVTVRMVTSPWPFIVLGVLDLIMSVAALATVGQAGVGVSLDALAATIAQPWGLAALGGTLVTLNLFVGTWIFRDSRYWSIGPLPYLLLAFLHGGFGLAAYLFVRRGRGTRDPVRVVN